MESKLRFLKEENKLKVLILDDSPSRRESFKERFSNGLFELDFCEHALDCIDLIKKNNYSLIFLDHDLGGKQLEFDPNDCGTVVARWIANNNNAVECPVIIHSLNLQGVQNMKKYLPEAIYIPLVWQKENFEKRLKFHGINIT